MWLHAGKKKKKKNGRWAVRERARGASGTRSNLSKLRPLEVADHFFSNNGTFTELNLEFATHRTTGTYKKRIIENAARAPTSHTVQNM